MESSPSPDRNLPPNNSESRLIVSSEELMQGRRELWIDHHGELYRLRITRSGKLYLTK